MSTLSCIPAIWSIGHTSFLWYFMAYGMVGIVADDKTFQKMFWQSKLFEWLLYLIWHKSLIRARNSISKIYKSYTCKALSFHRLAVDSNPWSDCKALLDISLWAGTWDMSSSNDIRNNAFSISSTLALFWLSVTSILKAVAQLSRLSDVNDLKRYHL